MGKLCRPTLATCALLAAMLPAHAQQLPVAWRPSLPPVEYDRPYKGQLIVAKFKDYSLIRSICHKDITVDAIACTVFTYDNSANGSCLIMLGPKAWDDARALRHEIGHCNGWLNDHVGARP